VATPPQIVDLAVLHERRDLARVRIQAIERDVERLNHERDELVAEVARLERTIEETEGAVAGPEVAHAWADRAREQLRRDQ